MLDIEKAQLFLNYFKGRQDVYGRQVITCGEDGKEIRRSSPVCENFYKEGCLIKTNSGFCMDCKPPLKSYEAVSAKTSLKHITGEESHCIYLLNLDNTVSFMAMDFDNKPDKPQLAYHWEDVKHASNVFKDLGIDHYVARSTTNGFHLYVFFKEPYPANKARAIMYEVFSITGFLTEHESGGRPIPEAFPRQSYLGDSSSLGNSLKPPMIEPNFNKERNGFVDENNEFIKDQWDFLSKAKFVETALLDKLIEERKLPVEMIRSSFKTSGYSPNIDGRLKEGKWQPPLVGSFEKVIHGCAAFRSIFENKCKKGLAPTHHEGFALLHVAMHTRDGIPWFDTNVTGWGESSQQRRQLEYSLHKMYKPSTCKKLQELGVCAPGTKCFDKKPMLDKEGPDVVVREDLPESQWPDPSPIRYAYGKGDDFLAKLKDEVELVAKDENPGSRLRAVQDIIKRSLVFDSVQQKELKLYIEEKKLLKKREMNEFFKEEGAKREKETRVIAENRPGTFSVGRHTFEKLSPHGYGLVTPTKTGVITKMICPMDIIIEEERTYLNPKEVPINIVYSGKVILPNREKKFEVDAKTWSDSNSFYDFFSNLLGVFFHVLREDADALRAATVMYSSTVAKSVKFKNYYSTQGWYGDSFLMPSVVIDKEGIRENSMKPVDLTLKTNDVARKLDFEMVTDSELQHLLFHIKSTLFRAFPRRAVFLAIAHTLSPPLLKILNFGFKPTLFMEGDSGLGKSQLSHFCQAFWGHFPPLANFLGTHVGMNILGSEFKDCLLVIDDFKNKDLAQTKICKDIIQYSYDGGLRVAATRSGKLRESVSNECLYMISGEQSPTNEASVIARSIIFEYDKDLLPDGTVRNTDAEYNQCLEMYTKYKGITPRYIHFIMQQNKAELCAERTMIAETLKKGVERANNAPRICGNMSLNFMAMRLFIDMMLTYGAVTPQEALDLKKEHWNFMLSTRDYIIHSCQRENNDSVFVNTLRELVWSGKAAIKGHPDYDREYAEVIGYVNQKDKSIIILYTAVTFKLVKSYIEQFNATKQSISRQLSKLGILINYDNGLTQRKTNEGVRSSVWEIRASELFGTPTALPCKIVESQHKPDKEGLI